MFCYLQYFITFVFNNTMLTVCLYVISNVLILAENPPCKSYTRSTDTLR